MARANIRQIEAFNAVIKGGSVTKAAEALFISQPAVTKLVQAFEQSCGFKLFVRSQGRLLPTQEARRLFSETEGFMTGVERIENTANAIRTSERGDISVVAYPALSLRLLPRYAARFLANRPDVRLTILTRNSTDISNSMLARAADFGISLRPTQDTGIICRPFRENWMCCALPAGHRLAGNEVIDLTEIENEPLICLGQDDQSRRVTDDALARFGVKVRRLIDVQMADTACMLVSEGLGISLVPSIASIGWEGQNIVFRPLAQPFSTSMWLYTSAWEEMSELAKLLLEAVENGIEEVEQAF
ncbi:LysR substrate-binding domain-containing protein [Martelella sp. HB161492]|uniref:LysR substrate-binding domain-containing protein n=1 Tax=Martelella sp. HB161492 TaxID=2720726 RepID=UPI001591D68E|nr:LysR substrate-binding domain-containing protein [Martelella sp. HB161492]